MLGDSTKQIFWIYWVFIDFFVINTGDTSCDDIPNVVFSNSHTVFLWKTPPPYTILFVIGIGHKYLVVIVKRAYKPYIVLKL